VKPRDVLELFRRDDTEGADRVFDMTSEQALEKHPLATSLVAVDWAHRQMFASALSESMDGAYFLQNTVWPSVYAYFERRKRVRLVRTDRDRFFVYLPRLNRFVDCKTDFVLAYCTFLREESRSGHMEKQAGRAKALTTLWFGDAIPDAVTPLPSPKPKTSDRILL
jgi:hypothetical protein